MVHTIIETCIFLLLLGSIQSAPNQSKCNLHEIFQTPRENYESNVQKLDRHEILERSNFPADCDNDRDKQSTFKNSQILLNFHPESEKNHTITCNCPAILPPPLPHFPPYQFYYPYHPYHPNLAHLQSSYHSYLGPISGYPPYHHHSYQPKEDNCTKTIVQNIAIHEHCPKKSNCNEKKVYQIVNVDDKKKNPPVVYIVDENDKKIEDKSELTDEDLKDFDEAIEEVDKNPDFDNDDKEILIIRETATTQEPTIVTTEKIIETTTPPKSDKNDKIGEIIIEKIEKLPCQSKKINKSDLILSDNLEFVPIKMEDLERDDSCENNPYYHQLPPYQSYQPWYPIFPPVPFNYPGQFPPPIIPPINPNLCNIEKGPIPHFPQYHENFYPHEDCKEDHGDWYTRNIINAKPIDCPRKEFKEFNEF